jgi:hypothetical protein
MLADELDYVVGVDPHRDTHALAIVRAGTGVAVLGRQVAASRLPFVSMSIVGYQPRALSRCCRSSWAASSTCLCSHSAAR